MFRKFCRTTVSTFKALLRSGPTDFVISSSQLFVNLIVVSNTSSAVVLVSCLLACHLSLHGSVRRFARECPGGPLHRTVARQITSLRETLAPIAYARTGAINDSPSYDESRRAAALHDLSRNVILDAGEIQAHL